MHRSAYHLPWAISCGFDAGEHEYPSMSRHHRKVPVGFYHRFTRETCGLADVYAHGRVVSVLEGGYSDRALTSGAMAHLCGLVDVPGQAATSDPNGWVDPEWWREGNLVKVRHLVQVLLHRNNINSHFLRSSKRLPSRANPRPHALAWRNGSLVLSVSSQYSAAVGQTLAESRRPPGVRV